MKKEVALRTPSLTMVSLSDVRHNMWVFEDVNGKRGWVVCADCHEEQQVSGEELERFLERAPFCASINLMGILRFRRGE